MSRRWTRRRFLQAAAISGAWAGRNLAVCGQTPSRLARLTDYVETAMTRWEVPGLALAVVKDGECALSRGFGVRALGDDSRVDSETLFPIASCTKSFTAAAIARLVDRGRLHWDDPIARHLPAFQLSDPQLTATITIRQALNHRTGLPTANMLWRRGDLNSEDIINRLRWLKPVAAPGERFLYNNNLYLVLGKIVEQVSGRTWIDVLSRELFEPLGMTSSVADSSGLRSRENVAAPHATDNGKLQRIQAYCPDTIAPAGGIHSNLRDLTCWVRMHLDDGRCDGQQVLSPTRIAEMHTPPQRDPIEHSAKPRVPRAPISRYGLGWFFNDYAGRQVIEHTGTQTGFVSWIALMPEERLGVVILANHHRTGLNSALRSWLIDAFLDRPEHDWSEAVRTDFTTGYQRLLREAKAKFDAERPAVMPPPRPLDDYVGTYESRLYSDLRIARHAKSLRLQFGTRFDGDLHHWQQDSFRVLFPNPRLDDWLVTFTVQNQRVTGMQVKESPWAPAWYDDADDSGEFVRG